MKNTIDDIWTFDGGNLEIDFDTSPFPNNLPGYEIPVDRSYLITIDGKAYVDLAHLMKQQDIDWQALGIKFVGENQPGDIHH